MVDLWLETNKTKNNNKKFHEINGFLSLQLGLSFELGLRLRLTNDFKLYVLLDSMIKGL